jgi:6-pyruvoyltetrahydropterin/6-carboxytetrahydropterin synthase
MFVISKEFRFEAAHHLEGLPDGHRCARPHGHSYTARVELASEDLDATGFVTDFTMLAPLGDYISAFLDHQDLNTVLEFQPSSELLAQHLYTWCQQNLGPPSRHVVAVAVSETPKTWAKYQPAAKGRL